MNENQIESGISQRANDQGTITSSNCIGNPNSYCVQASKYAVGCTMYQKDASTGYYDKAWINTGTVAVPVWTEAANRQIYMNSTGSTVYKLKIHNHLSTATTNAEFRYEYIGTSGIAYGINNEAHIAATGTASIYANFGVAVVDATFTVTGGTIIGSYGQARADGTVAGASFMAGLYGLIEASAAITASHVCSAWLDSHQANAVTGSHELLYMTNNGAAVMDQAIYIYAGNNITSLMEINTASGMVSDTATTAGTSKKIKITLNGVVHYINAYTG